MDCAVVGTRLMWVALNFSMHSSEAWASKASEG